ncbi:TSCPD domain-containing protein, partial [Phocaeicola sartorii]
MKITYKTQGTCSSHIEVEVEDDVIQQVFFWG